MSSIAYVTDEKMLEYHRLCCNRTILFWRLSTKNKFTDFHAGDLLFFFARGAVSKRKKGFVGYGHYVETRRLSLNQMWNQYGTNTGYDSKELLAEAIGHAAKGPIPRTMQCLVLSDIVFFVAPVYPKDVGIRIPANLESYCYLDKDDPRVTARILRRASKLGIDLWTAEPSSDPSAIFHADELRHFIANAAVEMGPAVLSEKERSRAHRLKKEKCREEGWEAVRGSDTDCLKMDKDHIEMALPFTCGINDRNVRLQEVLGRMVQYRLKLSRENLNDRIVFTLMMDEADPEAEDLVKELNERF
jgi:hypothetical protein